MLGDLENVEQFVIQTTPEEGNLLNQVLPLRKDNKEDYYDPLQW
jgi:hypothetical protein